MSMNSAKFQLDDEDRDQQHAIRRDHQMIMNGNRPSPLKINRSSYLIQKQQQQQRQPVIIYTQSPKVIHTQARDFMALVQKLTGLSRSNDINIHDDDVPDQTQHGAHDHVKADDLSSNEYDHVEKNSINTSSKSRISGGSHEDNDQSSSGLTDDQNYGGNYEDNKVINNVHHQGSSSSGYSPMFSHPSPYFPDIPLFTPTPTSTDNFFCSPRPLYRFSDSSSSHNSANVNVGGSISPSMFKFIKGLPEY